MNKIKVKMSKSTVIVIVCMVVLAVSGAALWAAGHSGADLQAQDAALLVKADGDVLKEYTMDDIKALPSLSVEKTIVSGSMGKNSGKPDESGIYTGVALEILMADADPDWEGRYSEFVLTAEDGFTSAVFLSEVQKGENVLVIYEKDGSAIAGREDGGRGPLRVIVADDTFGNRSAWYLKSIDAKE
ncbi:MAG: molybdopterin-dependent oxidoreductase [Clostridiales Family XIII bacterium]|jgi:DMSO/TMAO reductase YedYZ molybdopterin-dependent catalytic subunit|nr:molybdopterin-dependent oxidoreductase [Clostridiales Family XIII bacterium]